jgi:ribosomal protein L37E
MIVNQKFVSISDNENKIENFLKDVLFMPRLQLLRWAEITKQTPSFKVGYPVQHLASLITGVEGGRSGARGDDLSDSSEVKGCNRVDQVDKCKKCKAKVMRLEVRCAACGSEEIKRMDDSKWLIAIKNENELDMTINKIPRFVFIILHYPFIKSSNFETVRIESFEIWPKNNKNFRDLATNYYENIYLEHITKNPKKTPAPQNFWPFSFQFYLCMPIKTFECDIQNVNQNPQIVINKFVDPCAKRSIEDCEPMPVSKLTNDEIEHYGFSKKTFLNYKDIEKIDLRNTQKAIAHQKRYKRIKG